MTCKERLMKEIDVVHKQTPVTLARIAYEIILQDLLEGMEDSGPDALIRSHMRMNQEFGPVIRMDLLTDWIISTLTELGYSSLAKSFRAAVELSR